AFATIRLIGNTVSGWGALVAAPVLVSMLLLSRRFGVQSLAVIPLITLDAYTSYVADVGRAFFQSLRRTVSLGLYTLMWMMLRLIFCLVGVFLYRTAFGALLGIVTSTMVAYFIFRTWTQRKRSAAVKPSPLPSVQNLVPSIFGYGLLIAISNLDILLTYFIL